MNDRVGINRRIADRLLDQGRIQESEYLRAVEYAKRRGKRVEEALLELEMIDEAELLKFIATLHKTQFVSTEKLSRARIDRDALSVVGRRLAELHGVFPIMLDRVNDKLVVATADPDNPIALKELKMAAQVGTVLAMVARPAAVLAAQARAYENDKTHFRKLLHKGTPMSPDMLLPDPFLKRDGLPSEKRKTGEPQRGAAPPRDPSRIATGEYQPRETVEPPGPAHGSSHPPAHDSSEPPSRTGDPPITDAPHAARAPQRWQDDQQLTPPLPSDIEASIDALRTFEEPDDGRRTQPRPEARRAPPPDVQVKTLAAAAPFGLRGMASRRPRGPLPGVQVATTAAFLEAMRVLVGLTENDRGELRGHSALVARLAQSACERIRLPEEHTAAIVLACHLHDLGKMGGHHLTSLNVAQYDGHRDAARKLVRLPLQLMETVGLPDLTKSALGSMYELCGGGGFPDGLSGKDIPIGARILAACDTYADLTRNPRNAYRQLLAPEAAILVLREAAGRVLDPNIVDVLERATCGEKIASDLLADRQRVLIVDPNPEDTMVLQLRLVERGFDVQVARSLVEARGLVSGGKYALCVSEIDLEEHDAGFVLRQEVKQALPETGWVFLTARSSRTTARRAFDLDVDDVIAKPVSPELVCEKISQIVEKRAARLAPRGVSGTLSEMSLPDVVQILWHGRKTCALQLASGDTNGEIHFSAGQIVNAIWGGVQGEVAFYRMLALGEDGRFQVDPSFTPPATRVIDASPEALLLEGMRLLDEGAIP